MGILEAIKARLMQIAEAAPYERSYFEPFREPFWWETFIVGVFLIPVATCMFIIVIPCVSVITWVDKLRRRLPSTKTSEKEK